MKLVKLGSKKVFVISGFVVIFVLVFAAMSFESSDTLKVNPFVPAVMDEARFSRVDAVGDLGGMPVTIPRHFANFVEYEGDPGWSKREGPVPARDHHSKLVSFGFNVRFPDMVGLSSEELRENKQSFNIYNTPWIYVGITTGKNFGDGLGLERTFAGYMEENVSKVEHQMTKQFDLDIYTHVVVEANTKKIIVADSFDKDVFIERNAQGKLVGFITCSKVSHAAAPCDLFFQLDPNLKAWVNIIFRRSLLSEWKQMKSLVTTLVLDFRKPVDKVEANASSASIAK
ncbi:hypothetical protein [Undibacterium sp. Di24W]|uniref:hypothetical protein n=1 Tax=Undibacterium sp. Di24W TaxID=3413033 RepID=UPI003BF1BF48